MTEPKAIRCAQVIARIEEVFGDVRRDGGTTLNQGEARDDWAGPDEVAAAEVLDPEETWQELPDAKLADHDVFSFLDAKGFRFYLPAYLRMHVRALAADLPSPGSGGWMYSLQGEARTSAYEALEPRHGRVISEVLQLLADHDDVATADDAVAYLGFWERFLVDPPAPPAMHADRELDAAIHAHPDAREGYAVYADWLQQRGDLRGELAAVQLAREERPNDPELRASENALIARASAMIDHAHGDLRFGRVALEWRRGFIHGAVFPGQEPSLVRACFTELCALPAARVLRDLTIRISPEVLDVLAAPAVLRRLVAHLDRIDRPNDGIARLPVVEACLDRLLDGRLLPATLESLGLTRAFNGDAIVAMVARSKLLARLAHLDLSHGTIGEPGARTILAARDAFAHLETLDLAHNWIPVELQAELATVCPIVDLGNQRSGANRYLF